MPQFLNVIDLQYMLLNMWSSRGVVLFFNKAIQNPPRWMPILLNYLSHKNDDVLLKDQVYENNWYSKNSITNSFYLLFRYLWQMTMIIMNFFWSYVTHRVIFKMSSADSGILWSQGCRIWCKILLDIGITDTWGRCGRVDFLPPFNCKMLVFW